MNPILKLTSFFKTVSVMSIAIGISVLVHATVLAIKFTPEITKAIKRLPTLDVVLVNAKTKNAPKNATVIAQSNLDRGGNTDEDRQMKTALPSPVQKTTEVKLNPSKASRSAAKSAKLLAKKARQQKRVAELEKQAQALFTQVESKQKVESSPIQDAASAEPEKGEQKTAAKSFDRADLMAASLAIDRLEAQIAKQQEEYQKRPKRRFLGGRTMAHSDALYLESWRQKVERIGNLNYPSAARAQKIYGRLQMTVYIRADGSLEKMEINQSSGSTILDEAAKNIVTLAAPYAPFSKEMRKSTDIIGITRTWTFTQEDKLATK